MRQWLWRVSRGSTYLAQGFYFKFPLALRGNDNVLYAGREE
jgi:hypothetical protein